VPDAAHTLKPLVVVAALVAGVGGLYLARGVLIPIALAILLTFMVHPLVGRLSRLGLGRALSVGVVVTMLFATLGGVAWVLATELAALSTHIPAYRDNLIDKIAHVRRLGRGGTIEKAQSAVSDVAKELEKDTTPARPRPAPAPVVVESKRTGLWQLPTLIESLSGAATVILLVIFMLIEREDLRNRLIRLGGYGRLATTTRALDEAAQRISRYLVMQSVINASFGTGIAVGLLLFGVPYALLWGFLAAVLRFIPYVGVWLAALLLVTFTLAAFPTWYQPFFVAGLFVLLEAVCFALEPLLYGQSAGVSQVALLCSIAFWTWLWGPMGLLLATPLTVCLVVLAKYAPGMEFIGILMADAPPIAPPAGYYQRLLAEDRPEAARIVADYAKDHPLEAVYDDLILPALSHARRDRRQGQLPESAERYVWQATREIILDLHATRHAAKLAADAVGGVAPPELSRSTRKVHVLASPVRDEADELGLLMLRHLLDPARWTMELTSPNLLASEVIALVEKTRPAVVCLGALPASGLAAHTRYLCKRLRARFPELRIIVGRWGIGEQARTARRHLEAAGATYVGVSLVETRGHLQTVSGLEPVRPKAEIEA
jgi:predicted PurR-regulated permease PerM